MQSNHDKPKAKEEAKANNNSSSQGIMRLLKNDKFIEVTSNTAASTVLAFTFFPFEGYKKHLQAEIKGKFHPFRGSFIFAANFVPTSVIHLSASKVFHSLNPVNPSPTYNFFTSLACGVLGASVATFVENCITRQQLLTETPTPTAAIREMFKQSWHRPWKSYPLIATRDGIFTACMFSADDAVKLIAKQFYSPNTSSTMQNIHLLGAKFIVSALGAGLSHPFDTIATLRQKTHDNTSSYQIAKTLLKSSGVPGFYRGYPWRLVMFFAFSNLLPVFKNEAMKIADNPKGEFNRLTLFFNKPSVHQPSTPAHSDVVVENINTSTKNRR